MSSLLAGCAKEVEDLKNLHNSSEKRDLSEVLTDTEIKYLMYYGADKKTDDELMNEALNEAQHFGFTDDLGVQIEKQETLYKKKSIIYENLAIVDVYSKKDTGIIILSRDKCIQTALGCAEKGSIENTSDNKAFKMLLHNAAVYAVNEKIRQNQYADSIFAEAQRKLNENLPDSLKRKFKSASAVDGWVYTIESTAWQTTESKTPLLVTPLGWNLIYGQAWPYNKYCPYYGCTNAGTNGHAVVGCVPVACTYILLHHEYPVRFNGITIRWNDFKQSSSIINLTEEDRNQFAQVFAGVGQAMGVNYGCTATSGNSLNACNMFSALGYSSDGLIAYSSINIYSSLGNNRPVYIEGTSDESCHAWVLDGYRKRQRTMTYTATLIQGGVIVSQYTYNQLQKQTLYNCKFGWNGWEDGLYLSGAFDCSEGPLSGVHDPSTTDNYQYNLKVISNLFPNN